MLPGMELMGCQNLAVPASVMQHVVRVESSFNPYAIGVVGGHLVRQPRNLGEALATVQMLERRGFNFSLGLAQVNRYNLDKYGLASYEQAFRTCPNLQAGSRILAECHRRSGGNWGKAFSCYYSGNFVTGYRHGYVQKVYASMQGAGSGRTESVDGLAIKVVGRPTRKAPTAGAYPLRADPASRPSRIAEADTAAPTVVDATASAPAPSLPSSNTTVPMGATTPAAPVGEPGPALPPQVVRLTPNGPMPAGAPAAAPPRPSVPRVATDQAFVF